jgi:hypothetical protein
MREKARRRVSWSHALERRERGSRTVSGIEAVEVGRPGSVGGVWARWGAKALRRGDYGGRCPPYRSAESHCPIRLEGTGGFRRKVHRRGTLDSDEGVKGATDSLGRGARKDSRTAPNRRPGVLTGPFRAAGSRAR